MPPPTWVTCPRWTWSSRRPRRTPTSSAGSSGSWTPSCRPGAILATNTSSISVTMLAAVTTRPEAVIGMHFMNPVPVMRLVEIIRALQTSDGTFRAIRDLTEKIGKVPVCAGDSPGFISNRVLLPMVNEAVYCLYEGVGTAADIDGVMTLGMNHPLGPLALADLIGLDVCLDILGVLYEGFKDSKYRPCPLAREDGGGRPSGAQDRPGVLCIRGSEIMTGESRPRDYEPLAPSGRVRFVTAASLFDGHDVSINIVRRVLQDAGAEVVHLGHNRSVDEIVDGGGAGGRPRHRPLVLPGRAHGVLHVPDRPSRRARLLPHQGVRGRRRRHRAARGGGASRVRSDPDLQPRGWTAFGPRGNDPTDDPGMRRTAGGRRSDCARPAAQRRDRREASTARAHHHGSGETKGPHLRSEPRSGLRRTAWWCRLWA